MNTSTCPNCGAGNCESYLNDCDIERCSVCGSQKISCDCLDHDPQLSARTGEWPKKKNASNGDNAVFYECDEYVIFDSTHPPRENQSPKNANQVTSQPERRYSDAFIAGNQRIEWGEYAAEPVVKNGVNVGPWKIGFLRPGRNRFQGEFEWVSLVRDRDAALEWGRST